MTTNCNACETAKNSMAKPRRSDTERRSVGTTMPRILLAEDDREMRALLASQLRRAGYQVVECCDGEHLVQQLASTFLPSAHRNDFDLVISDIRMPGFTGLEVLDGLYDRVDFPPMILITAFGDAQTHARARRLGAIATLDKPFRIPDLVAIVHRFTKHQLRQDPQGIRAELPRRGAALHPRNQDDNDKEDSR